MEKQDPQVRSWSAPSEVTAGTGVARQLRLMSDLAGGQVSGPEFARAWLSARRKALSGNERVRDDFERILYDVFYVLDEYVIDPALRDADDITDEQVTDRVRDSLERLRGLECRYSRDPHLS